MTGELITPTGRLVMSAEAMHADRAGWLALRRGRDDVPGFYCLGSSEMASILNTPGSGTVAMLWAIKVKGAEQPDNAAMMWGRLHEDTIARYWRDRNRSVTEPIGLLSHDGLPWHQSTMDRLVKECPLDRAVRRMCALEIKTRGAFGSRRFHADLPDDILAQVCHQLFVSGLDHLHYAILVGGNDYRQGVVRADAEADTIRHVITTANTFRDTHLRYGAEVEPEWPPGASPDRMLELDRMLHPDRVGDISIVDVGEVMELAELRATANTALKAVKEQTARLAKIANGAKFVTMADEFGTPQLVFSYDDRRRTKVDVDALAERYPQAYADPEVVTHKTTYQLTIAPQYKPTTAPEE